MSSSSSASPQRVPRATYRLQLNKDFTFAQALALLPYLESLGVSHLYLSPILKAQPGSTHGYDTVDHARINPELGTREDFRRLAEAAHARGLGVLLDFVPNHMGVGGADNALWLDVLKHGPKSRYADWFDIDWQGGRRGMAGKLLVPFLGSRYAEALAGGDLELVRHGDGFAVLAYGATLLPLRPEDDRALLERHDNADAALAAHAGETGRDRLDGLIANQHWRLAHFAVAGDEINYRRFFINSELAGIRIEREDVFDHAHGLIFDLVAEGLVDGLRIDHVDGLRDPKAYLQTLRAKAPRPIYLVIEKILAPHEALRADWPVDGTTGYEVGTELTRVLMQPEGQVEVDAAYREFVGDVVAPEAETRRAKLGIMDGELYAELDMLSRRLADLAWSRPRSADLTRAGLRRALRATMAELAVYRTYVDADGTGPRDRREIERAVAAARLAEPQVQPANFDFLLALLSGGLEGYDKGAAADVVARIQQYSGPVMAKGLEDTALYRYNRLVALNEVGAHPDRFSMTIDAFHDANLRRLEQHPASMIATSTHDTKRGEDTRAVIAAIADAPALWAPNLERWRNRLPPLGGDKVHPNDLYLLLQLLLGGWPMDGGASGLAERLKAAMQKSVREGRQRSDWGVNNAGYETQLDQLIDAMFADAAFLADFGEARTQLQAIGRRKGLIQVALKLTIPGVPDIYRGAEDWEQSYVDPDNRRAVDFAGLGQRLARPEAGRDDKLVLTQALLAWRKDVPTLFSEGSYEPLDAGPSTLAFRRHGGGSSMLVLADLSPGHLAGFSTTEQGRTIAGSKAGPFWILAD